MLVLARPSYVISVKDSTINSATCHSGRMGLPKCTLNGLPEDGVICNACRKDVTRAVKDSTFVSRWCKYKAMCSIPGCLQCVYGSLHKPVHNLDTTMAALKLKAEVTPTLVPLPLCKLHYHKIYKQLEPVQRHCATCGTSLRHSNPKPKLCPQPLIIERHLYQHTDFEGTLTKMDKECYSCYSLIFFKSTKV